MFCQHRLQPDNTQNYNRYAYCFNNPLKFNDPTGHEGEPINYEMYAEYPSYYAANYDLVNATLGNYYSNPMNYGTLPYFNNTEYSYSLNSNILDGQYVNFGITDVNQTVVNATQVSGGDFALSPLITHYLGGSGSDYVMSENSFNGFVSTVATTNGINYKNGIPVPNQEGLYKIDVSAYGTKYENTSGAATLYYNNTGVVGYSDYWNFESHTNGDRGIWGEIKTKIGSAIPGSPFFVLYGLTPPTNEIPTH